MASDLVTESSVYECVGHPSKNDVKTIINVLLNENFTVASQSKKRIQIENFIQIFTFSIIKVKNDKRLCISRYSY